MTNEVNEKKTTNPVVENMAVETAIAPKVESPATEDVTSTKVTTDGAAMDELKTMTACGHIYQVHRQRDVGPYGSRCTTFRLREVRGKVFYAWGTSSFSRRTYPEDSYVSVVYTENKGRLGRSYAKAIQPPQVEEDPAPRPKLEPEMPDAAVLVGQVCKDFNEFYKVTHRLLKDAKKLMAYVEEGLVHE